jgi:hypothetical protein
MFPPLDTVNFLRLNLHRYFCIGRQARYVAPAHVRTEVILFEFGSYVLPLIQLGPTGLEERPTRSRLSNCSSATSVNNVVPSGRLLRVRTASASSINTASIASVSSTPLLSAESSPRTPGTARSPAATAIAQTRRRDKARVATSYVVIQSGASSKSKPGAPAPTCTRAHPTPGVSSPRSTASTSRQPSLLRRGDVAMARSRLASQSSGTGSRPQPRDVHPTSRGASGVASSSNGTKSRQVAPAVKQGGAAAASTTTQRWRYSPGPGDRCRSERGQGELVGQWFTDIQRRRKDQ